MTEFGKWDRTLVYISSWLYGFLAGSYGTRVEAYRLFDSQGVLNFQVVSLCQWFCVLKAAIDKVWGWISINLTFSWTLNSVFMTHRCHIKSGFKWNKNKSKLVGENSDGWKSWMSACLWWMTADYGRCLWKSKWLLIMLIRQYIQQERNPKKP